MIQKTFRRLLVLQKGLKHRLSMVSTIHEITRQDGQAKTEDVLNYQHKDIPNERPKCGSEGRQTPLWPDDPGS